MPTEKQLANLRSFADMTATEQRVIQSAGGKASGESRRRRKTQAEIIRQIMELKLTPEEGADKLEALGLDPTWATDANVAVMQKARRGDVESLRYLRDTIGEKPVQDVKVSTGDFSALDEALKGMKK